MLLQEPRQLGFQRLEAGQLGLDLGQPLSEQGFGVAAGTLAPVGDLEQLTDSRSRSPARWAPLISRSRPTAA